MDRISGRTTLFRLAVVVMQVTATAKMRQLTPELAVAAEDLLLEYSKLHCMDSRGKGKAWKHPEEPLRKELRQGNLLSM